MASVMLNGRVCVETDSQNTSSQMESWSSPAWDLAQLLLKDFRWVTALDNWPVCVGQLTLGGLTLDLAQNSCTRFLQKPTAKRSTHKTQSEMSFLWLMSFYTCCEYNLWMLLNTQAYIIVAVWIMMWAKGHKVNTEIMRASAAVIHDHCLSRYTQSKALWEVCYSQQHNKEVCVIVSEPGSVKNYKTTLM